VPNPANTSAPSIVIGAGGTGGHIYPGLAVADALRAKRSDAKIVFVGTPRGLERKLIPKAGYELATVDMLPFSMALGWRMMLFPFALIRAVGQSVRLLRQRHADVVLGMGGYPSVPAVVAAYLTRRPRIIHESNATPGLANRFVSRFVADIALAFDAGAIRNPGDRRHMRVIGMPLNSALAGFDREMLHDQARAHFGVAPNQRMVLVNGGSLGAVRLSQSAVDLAARWRDRDEVKLVIKAGKDQLTSLKEQLAASGGDRVATAVAYLDRMDLAYAAADIAVCRAGSGTVAELAHVGLPAILVPYPSAAHDHQTFNAQALVRTGGALMLRDDEVTAQRLEQLLDPVLADPAALAKMAAAVHQPVHTNAAAELADWVLQLGGAHHAEETAS
jgi:UDP-N-acetylglucosamine--N-acetylmuramyl-(pentapeptide) pyrophosphoryl-undecaprenol N-acetylglucosamine transferase